MAKELTDEQIITKAVDTFRKKAQTAYDNHQETGEARYNTDYIKYEAIADALARDAEKAEYRQALGSIRAMVAALAGKIAPMEFMPDDVRLAAADKLLADLEAYASMEGLISRQTLTKKEG
ncbi:MAG: hypothetical protein RR350_09445 [Oscillibacter sp.]